MISRPPFFWALGLPLFACFVAGFFHDEIWSKFLMIGAGCFSGIIGVGLWKPWWKDLVGLCAVVLSGAGSLLAGFTVNIAMDGHWPWS